ncbi:hypothetical protein HYH02_012244 [Chlamydomonas schloesseri]|uniref:Uncharacterized protein n=1 Tax=Chlamydomonas schloesseri TaxID=2026947 RepID=A0A835W2A5_9CHLO|nr:hypothetical protein HYH02_012244 [Chlamydomonas schloesseri]|eukprot:KAG2434414.1 hypothetical protein HYH02_012244 [Chlamydomonas schloesseri]
MHGAFPEWKVVLGQKISNIKKQKGAKRGPDVAATGATTAAAGTAAATTAAPVAGAAAEQAAEPEDRAPEAQRQPLQDQQAQQGKSAAGGDNQHVLDLANADVSKGFLLCGLWGKQENVGVVAVGRGGGWHAEEHTGMLC